jgi:ATP-dependent DNA helicase HFM1/MER3
VVQCVSRYEDLVSGAELVESQLKDCLKEYLMAEMSLRTVTDVSMAIDWLKSTFFYIRVCGGRCSHCCKTGHSARA